MKRLRILYLEDNPADAELVQLALAKGGLECETTVVDSGSEYIAAIDTNNFDLILSDSSIPGFSGEAALTTAKKSVLIYPLFSFLRVQIRKKSVLIC